MKPKLISLILVLILTLTTLAACGDSGIISAEEAEKIALKASGYSEKQVTDIHTHVGTYEDQPCYSIHITVDGNELEFMVDGDGNILN